MLRSDTVTFQQREERSGEPHMVNDEMLRPGGGEILKKEYCIAYLKTLRNFNNQVYQDFINLMKAFKPEGDDCIETLKQKVKDLLEGRPDLILGFNAFLPKRQKINIPIPIKVQTTRTIPILVLSRKRKRDDSDVVDAKSSDSKLQKVIDFVNKVKERLCKDDGEEGDKDFQSFLDIFSNNHSKGKESTSPDREKASTPSSDDEDDIYNKVTTHLKDHPDLTDEFTNFLPKPRLCKIIKFSNFETCSPSYYVLPENFPIPATTNRSELASRVLNDRFISVDTRLPKPEGRGGEGDTEPKKLCWDDEFEQADRTVNIIGSVSLSIKALLEKIEEDSPSEIYIEDHFMELHLKYIKGLYDEQGLKAMDELRKNIRLALPVLLNRLKQQEEESMKKRQSLTNQRRAHHVKVLSWRQMP